MSGSSYGHWPARDLPPLPDATRHEFYGLARGVFDAKAAASTLGGHKRDLMDELVSNARTIFEEIIERQEEHGTAGISPAIVDAVHEIGVAQRAYKTAKRLAVDRLDALRRRLYRELIRTGPGGLRVAALLPRDLGRSDHAVRYFFAETIDDLNEPAYRRLLAFREACELHADVAA